MIIAFTGMPGAGKSYALVQRAYKALKEGRNVYANFPIKGVNKFTLDDLCNYAFPENSVIIIDEAGRWFNSRNWGNLPPEVFDIFTMHRHLRCDMYIGVQSFARIDKSLREVIELTYWARKVPLLPLHRYEGYYDLEKVGSMRKDSDVNFYIPVKKLYRSMYNTHSMKSTFHGKPEMPKERWSILPRPKSQIIKRYLRIKKNALIRKMQNRMSPYKQENELAQKPYQKTNQLEFLQRKLMRRQKDKDSE